MEREKGESAFFCFWGKTTVEFCSLPLPHSFVFLYISPKSLLIFTLERESPTNSEFLIGERVEWWRGLGRPTHHPLSLSLSFSNLHKSNLQAGKQSQQQQATHTHRRRQRMDDGKRSGRVNVATPLYE